MCLNTSSCVVIGFNDSWYDPFDYYGEAWWNFDPPAFDEVVEARVYVQGGQCLMRGKRLLLSKYGNLIMKFIFQIDCNEFTTSYRGFNLKKLNNFHLNLIKTKGYSFFMGTVYEVFRQKFRIKEIPIIFKDRKKGYSKIPRAEIFRTIKNILLLKLTHILIKTVDLPKSWSHVENHLTLFYRNLIQLSMWMSHQNN